MRAEGISFVGIEYADDEHVIATNEHIEVLAGIGFKANCDTIRDDVSMLNEAGYEGIFQLSQQKQ